MNTAVSQDKELFRHISLLTNEIIQTQQPLQRLDSLESQMRGALDDLLSEKKRLREQINRMESIAKDAASSAIEDAEQEDQARQDMEKQKNILGDQIRQLEQGLQSKEATLAERQQHFSDRINDLTEQLKQKENLLQFRSNMLKELNTTIDSMNRIATGLASLQESGVIMLDDPQVTQATPARDEIKQIEERMSAEIEKLKRELCDRELAIALKSQEIEWINENASAKIQDLQRGMESKNKKRSPVAFLTELGPKRFL